MVWQLHPPAWWRGMVDPGKMASVGNVGKGFSIEDLPSALSPKAHNPQVTVVCFVLLSLYQSSRWLAANEILCFGPFTGCLGLLQIPCVSLVDIILLDFHSLMVYAHLFPDLVLWAGETIMGLRPHIPLWEALKLKYSFRFSVVTVGMGPTLFSFPQFLWVLIWFHL